MKLSLEIFGDVQLNRSLLRLGTRLHDLTPVFNVMADEFLVMETLQFNSEGGFASGGWAPDAESTLAHKAALGLDMRVMHATLALRNSLTQKGAEGAVRRIGPQSMEVGTEVRSSTGFPYAAAHQKPQAGGRKRRRVVELRPIDRNRWVKHVQRFVVTGSITQGFGL